MSHVEHAPDLYKALFKFPSIKKLIIISAVISIVLGLAFNSIIKYNDVVARTIYGLLEGGVVFLVPTILSAYISYLFFRNTTKMLDFRRLTAESILDTGLWGLICIIGGLVGVTFGDLTMAFDAFIIGAATTLGFRILVFSALSFSSSKVNILVSLIKPVMVLAAAYSLQVTFLAIQMKNVTYWGPRFLIASALIILGVAVYMTLVNRPLKISIGFGGLTFLRAFLADWLEDDNKPIEDLFDRLGEYATLPFAVIKTRSKQGLKAVTVIPSIHPGPFRNVGGSNLPAIITQQIEEKLGGKVLVFHGPSTHSLNLATSLECQKVVEKIENAILSCEEEYEEATPLVRVTESGFNVTCQILGDFCLITTSALNDTEDISLNVASKIYEALQPRGVKKVFIADAHNSKNKGSKRRPITGGDEAERLKEVTIKAVKEAMKLKKGPVKIGVSRIHPPVTRKEGIGDAGIATQIIEVNNQKAAYVLIDGNNMISGLREKIVNAVKALGIDEAEVLTSDTHSVDAISLEAGNYVGLNYSEEKIIEYVKESVSEALKNMENVTICTKIDTIENLKVSGKAVEKVLKNTIKAMEIAKKSLPIIMVLVFSTIAMIFALM
ncbi:MAG: DUF2070 family protein [Candidatus Odinarchaeia archaeon]